MKRWTDDEIVQAMRDWEEIFGSPPNFSDWRRADPQGLYPSAEAVRSHFGSWTAGLANAFPPPIKQKPLGYWTRERIIEAFHAWAKEHDGLPPGTDDLGSHNELPSPQTLKRRFGSKAEAMKAAGLINRPPAITNRQIAKFLPLKRR